MTLGLTLLFCFPLLLKMSAIFLVALAALVACVAVAQDPAPGWLGYAKASGNGTLLTYIEAKWVSPLLSPVYGQSALFIILQTDSGHVA